MRMGDLKTDGWILRSNKEGLNWDHIRAIYQFWKDTGEAVPRQFVETNLDKQSMQKRRQNGRLWMP